MFGIRKFLTLFRYTINSLFDRINCISGLYSQIKAAMPNTVVSILKKIIENLSRNET